MTQSTRRSFMGAAAMAVAGGVAGAAAAQQAGQTVKILGICCSPRKDKSTAAVLRACLDAAKASRAGIEVELIDLAGLKINGDLAAGIPLEPGQQDDFPTVEARLRQPNVGGIIIATPVYFSNMTSLCKAFLDRCAVFRKNFDLRDKIGGAIAVGAGRNGGQELTIQTIHATMLCHDMIIVADGRPTSRLGGIVVAGEDPMQDVTGMATVTGLGRRVAEVAARLARTAG